MKLRHIVSICLLTLPLTCFAETLSLPIIVSSAQYATPPRMPGWLVIDFLGFKSLPQYASKEWKITCDYTVTGQGIVVLKPEINGAVGGWSGRVIDGNLNWSTGSYVETFYYRQQADSSPNALHLQSVGGDSVVAHLYHPCVAISLP